MNTRDAINTILLNLNEAPLDVTDVVADIGIATTADVHLANARRSILSQGWYFNSITLELVPNLDGYISIPYSFLSIDGGASEPNLTMRDWKLFDKAELTYTFEDNKSVDVIEDIPFDDIPFVCADYIVAVASYNAYKTIIGDAEGIKILRQDLIFARIEAVRDDANNIDGNLLEDTHSSSVLDKTSL